MIGWLSGVVLIRDPAQGVVVINVGGVGYEVRVSLQTLAAVGEPDELCTLWVYTHAREDQLLLFGFANPAEKELFLLLLGVPKVGPKHALAVLGGFPFSELVEHLRSGRQDQLQKIPRHRQEDRRADPPVARRQGRGASRTPASAPVAAPAGSSPLQEDAKVMLVDLGWRIKEVETALARVVAAGWSDEGGALDDLVRRALAQLMDR